MTGKIQILEILIAENKIFTDKLQALEKLTNTYNKNIQTQRNLEQNLNHNYIMKLKRNRPSLSDNPH